MSFTKEEVVAALAPVPADRFLGLDEVARYEWVRFVTSVDNEPKNAHDVMFYAVIARALAELVGSAQPVDFAESHMRAMILDALKVGAEPFHGDGEDAPWDQAKVTGAQVFPFSFSFPPGGTMESLPLIGCSWR